MTTVERIKQGYKNGEHLMDSIRRLLTLEKFECNLCGHYGRFYPFGDSPRRGSSCGRCDCKERHRLVKLWFDRNIGEVSDKRILHFAPEPALRELFRAHAGQYCAADINANRPYVDVVLNIESIDLPDESVDIVVASHILEHVDDAKTLSEIHRILSAGGLAVLMFPVIEGWTHTYENASVTTPADRTTHFGQFDHVRYYGSDVRARIRDAGFALSEFTAEEPYVSQHGLMRGEKLFLARKG